MLLLLLQPPNSLMKLMPDGASRCKRTVPTFEVGFEMWKVTFPCSIVHTRNPRKPPLGCKLVVAKRELLRFLLQIEEEVPVWLWSLALCALEPAAAAACLLLLLGCLWCFALSIDSFDFLNARRFMGNWHGFWDCIDFCGLV